MKRILSSLLCLCMVVTAVLFNCNPVKAASIPNNANLLNTYGSVFDHVGTAIEAHEILNPNKLNYASKEYNSITVGNEMKPDYILGWQANTMSVQQAKQMGYYIPSNYREQTIPRLDFSTVDKMLKACYDKGLKMRGHTFVWHSQTPDWFFRRGFTKYGNYVSQAEMDARMEFYIKTYMNHVCQSKYGSIIYAWDVVNEYLHANSAPSGWQKIYGSNLGSRAPFVKKAFQYAYESLEYFKLTNKVHLFYNDYNTYMEVNDVINLVDYVNSGKKVCAGVGMQSHLSSNYPSPAYYKQALQAFCRKGYEVQITELDAGGKNDTDQANYFYNIMKAILDCKKAGGNISAVVWWGLADDTSWRRNEKPLLYSRDGVKKPSYNAVLQAFFDSGYKMGGNNQPSNPQPSNPQPSNPQPSNPQPSNPQPGNSKGNVRLSDGWYYIKNVNSQKYLQVAGNRGAAGTNVEIGHGTGVQGQKWYLQNTSDGYITLKSGLGNFMLDLAYGKNENGTNLQIYNAMGHDAQKFYLQKANGNNVVTIATKVSNGSKSVDVYNFGKNDGTNVCQWSTSGNVNQQFIFEPVR